ncbi:MAG: acyl-phosphate glycerol 3-phosphate acyltransferase [Archangium gephyra]|uniref:Glycerol-3-phosphate acyltransferase n=1 Tax=Archangium gephyra TaxID=48 RepID=A0A2W5W697_9BACT|nr:MAG: acyl-phosphate glycerol 3-phosphate acyltransferase [Archangium gephyra]
MIWALVAVGYFAGSIPFGVIVTSFFTKKDVRAEGSGNIGATNVARVAGKKLGAVVLLLDAAKGALPVWAALWLAPAEPMLHVAVAAAAFLGHVFPVWLQFKGGKGVATALGVLLVLLPFSALIGFVTWALILLVTRVSSIGSLVGAFLAIVSAFLLGSPLAYALLAVALLLAMLWTHRGNIERILKRTENKV